VLPGDAPAVVDPGPHATVDALRTGLAAHGLAIADLRAILLTHIHLDHAGATGALVRENPRLRVYVHERGAAHIIDPTRLLASARRLYGDALEDYFGEMVPVSAENVTTLRGGELIELADRTVNVADAPGHAKHHVAYFDQASGTAFVGDAAGIRNGDAAVVFPVTPPPDIDLDAWQGTVDRILAWNPQQLFLTHFGVVHHPHEHFDQFQTRLRDWAARVRSSLALPDTDDASRAQAFAQEVEREVRRALGANANWYITGGDLEACWQGLARYWRLQPV
jgi:glyoxylase-like metal-dependent hydrolase (beta-lactamase superfamily II)